MKFNLLILILCTIPDIACADNITLDFGNSSGSGFSSRLIQIIATITVLSVAPSILIMVTSFTRVVVVFSLLRTALGLQQTPPNSVLISLALFLTLFIMTPTMEQAYNDGVVPLVNDEIDEVVAFDRIMEPFQAFMKENTREKDLSMFRRIVKVENDKETPLQALIPAFMISELKRAFEIGFLIFLPFLIIDMLVASTLMAMGMMMLPPPMLSLPFKLIFFVLIDGWYMLSGSLVKSYIS